MIDQEVEELAKALADTRYKVLDPPMQDAFNRLSVPTKNRYREQAKLLMEMGWEKK